MVETKVVFLIYAEILKVLGGAVASLAVLSAFLGKVWINRIASRESQVRQERIAQVRAALEQDNPQLRPELDAAAQERVFADKLLSEHKYSIYKHVWEPLSVLRQATIRLHPMMGWDATGESEDERMKRRISAFIGPFNTYQNLIERNKLFYAETVRRALLGVLYKCYSERADYEYKERPQRDYYEEARRNHEAVVLSIYRARQAT